MKKITSGSDVGLLNALYNAFIQVCILTVIFIADNECHHSHILLSREVLEEVVEDFIKKYDIGCILQELSSADTASNKKRKMVEYDRQRASKCVRSNWYSPCPKFDDCQFERTFHIEKSMVECIICHLTAFDLFWLQSIDCCGRESIDPIVKFLSAQKLICYGVSFSAFKDYFQIGESTARLCLRKLTRGIVMCSAISDQYL